MDRAGVGVRAVAIREDETVPMPTGPGSDTYDMSRFRRYIDAVTEGLSRVTILVRVPKSFYQSGRPAIEDALKEHRGVVVLTKTDSADSRVHMLVDFPSDDAASAFSKVLSEHMGEEVKAS